MARKPRIEYEGAFYHVIIRGNQRQKTFKDKEDFIKYLGRSLKGSGLVTKKVKEVRVRHAKVTAWQDHCE